MATRLDGSLSADERRSPDTSTLREDLADLSLQESVDMWTVERPGQEIGTIVRSLIAPNAPLLIAPKVPVPAHA